MPIWNIDRWLSSVLELGLMPLPKSPFVECLLVLIVLKIRIFSAGTAKLLSCLVTEN